MLERLAYINRLFSLVMDFIYPPHCVVCSSYIIKSENESKFLCKKCLFSFPLAPAPEIITNEIESLIGADDLAVHKFYSLMRSDIENPFFSLIYSMKYHGKLSIGYEAGKLLGKLLLKENCPKYDLIIPVPIHIAKKRERGFNQSDNIARGISEVIDVKWSDEVVSRSKYTLSQTNFDAITRKHNVKNIFQIELPSEIEGKTVLIIDDVLTTGSTINSLADTLLMNKCLRADAATIFRA